MNRKSVLLLALLTLLAVPSLNCAAEPTPSVAKPAAKATTAPGPSATQPAWPSAEISNGIVTLKLALPDAENGFYRGTRFDWSGQVAQATYKGHTYFEFWRKKHNPLAHDHGIGIPEEFDMDSPPGYDEAAPGETFIKIGVGHLTKAKAGKYRFNERYELAAAPWRTTVGKDRVEYVQTLSDKRGWGYVYTKRISLPAGEARFVVVHTLKNTGTKPIKTTHYCHNFFQIDKTPVGMGNYKLVFPFKPTGRIKTNGAPKVTGTELVLTEEIKGAFWAGLDMEGGWRKPHNKVVIVNTKTGAAVAIEGDRAPVQFNLYAETTAICPEPFVEIEVAPGKSETWTNTYTLTADGE